MFLLLEINCIYSKYFQIYLCK